VAAPQRPPLPWICLVTDSSACVGGFAALERTVGAALDGGVNVVQLREKSLPSIDLYKLGCCLRRMTSEANALLVVNDRVDVAEAIGADGVHLGATSLPIPVARSLIGDRLVGRSVHDASEADNAARNGADYLIAGTIFPSATHPGQPGAGVGLLEEVTAMVTLPVLAIGGITIESAAQVIAAGASGVAIIRAVLADPDPERASRRLVETVRSAWRAPVLQQRAQGA
jgi:thiamine-phosphate pyrophosphorylase